MKLLGKDVVVQPCLLVLICVLSTAAMWSLFSLSLNPSIQSRLRTECQSCPTDAPGMDALNSLPYLDAVVRETLRLHASVTSTLRVAEKDDEIPLSEPIVDARGKICETIS